MINVSVQGCGHVNRIECGRSAEFVKDPSKCVVECGKALACGHTCKSRCGAPWLAGGEGCAKHGKCRAPCPKMLPCGHLCNKLCHPAAEECAPCTKPCDVKCNHTKCNKPCSEVCSPCVEPCDWDCPHAGRCLAPCGAPCTRLPCDERCSKMLPCGHPCPSLCGEPCPPKNKACRECAPREAMDHGVDLISLETLSEYSFESGPLVHLSCGHVFAVQSLDAHVELSTYYAREGEAWIRPIGRPAQLQHVKGCPDCRQPITGVRRYWRVINMAQIDHMTRKYIVNGMGKLAKLSQKIDSVAAAEDNPAGAAAAAAAAQPQPRFGGRGLTCAVGSGIAAGAGRLKALSEIVAEAEELSSSRQPIRAIYDASRVFRSKLEEAGRSSLPDQCEGDIRPPDNTVRLEAMLIAAKAQTLALQAQLAILVGKKAGGGSVIPEFLDAESYFAGAFQALSELVSLAEADGRRVTVRTGQLALVQLCETRARCVIEWALGSTGSADTVKQADRWLTDDLVESIVGQECGLRFCVELCSEDRDDGVATAGLRVACAELLGATMLLQQRRLNKQPSAPELLALTDPLFTIATSVLSRVSRAGGVHAPRAIRVHIQLLGRRAACAKAAGRDISSILLEGTTMAATLPPQEHAEAVRELRAAADAAWYEEVKLEEKRMVFAALGELTNNNRTNGMGNHW